MVKNTNKAKHDYILRFRRTEKNYVLKIAVGKKMSSDPTARTVLMSQELKKIQLKFKELENVFCL